MKNPEHFNAYEKAFEQAGKLPKAFWKWSGTNFYQNWILTTNPSTKNPALKAYGKMRYPRAQIKGRQDLKKRIQECKKNISDHLLIGVPMITIIAEVSRHIAGIINDPIQQEALNNFAYLCHSANVWANLYPVFVQLKIGARIQKLLDKEFNKSFSTKESDEKFSALDEAIQRLQP